MDVVVRNIMTNPLFLSGLVLVTRLVALAALAFALRALVARFVPRMVSTFARLQRREDAEQLSALEEQKRRETISHVLLRTVDVLLLTVIGFMALGELGFDLAPLIASAGVAGLAIGFGAQTLVRDVLAGIFVLLENQYAKGDAVKIAGISGVVEDINLRRTVLRDADGALHSVPNGEIRVATNMTRGWSLVTLNVRVSYEEDLDRVMTVLNQLGADVAADKSLGAVFLEPPKVLRVDEFAESGVILKMAAKIKPAAPWDVASELRRRIKATFDEEGIEIPYLHTIVISREDGRAPKGDSGGSTG